MRIRVALAAPVVLSSGVALAVSASVGVAEAGPGEDTEAVLRRADAAMYEEKRQ